MNRIQFVETFIRREDAERFIAEVQGDDPGLASYLRIEERELETGGLNQYKEGAALARFPRFRWR